MYLHEKRVSVVYGIPQLKGKNCVGSHFSAPLSDLVRCESVLVESVVPPDSLQSLDVTAQEPVAGLVDHPHVRMSGVVGAELPAASLLLAVEEELGSSEYRHLPVVVLQAHRRVVLQAVLVGLGHRQDYRDRLVYLLTVHYEAL